MFVRIAWRHGAKPDDRQALRRTELAGRREADDLGRPGPDFAKMTLGLFDRCT